MGLLDDAIREHLELKRRRGADPGEVAREQREALDPDPRSAGADAEEAEHDAPVAEDTGRSASVAAPGVVPVAALPVEDHAEQAPHSSRVEAGDVDETAELDMRTVLGQDQSSQASARRAAEATPVEDSLEWEVPGEVVEDEFAADEPAEDVLEETPDFLRDTPEQERLWFEQRPPRDFDFDQ